MRRLLNVLAAVLIAGGTALFPAAAAVQGAVDKAQETGECNVSSAKATIDRVALCEAAWRASPYDVKKQFAYALVAPCSVSVALFTAISGKSGASDSLRAEAYMQLGDYSFIYSAFKTAAEKYAKAIVLSDMPKYRYAQAKALVALVDSSAAGCIAELLPRCSGDFANKVLYLKALHAMHQGRYDTAFSALAFTRETDPAKPYYAAAIAAKLECALRLGKNSDVPALKKAIAPWEGKLLEEGRLRQLGPVATNVRAASSAATRGDDNHSGTEVFTLQVGAFGSLDNATVLQKKMEALFTDVTVLPASMAESVIYRVRVGSFTSKYAAELFGNDSLAAAGVQFRVVTK